LPLFYIVILLLFLPEMIPKYVHRYRNRINIITQLLNGASTPLTKTNMMYRMMVFYEQLKEYLVMLAQNDIIVYDKPSRRFATIERGYQFVKRYDGLIELIEPRATIAERTQEGNICQ
jgi:predicted transcriptional regulator